MYDTGALQDGKIIVGRVSPQGKKGPDEDICPLFNTVRGRSGRGHGPSYLAYLLHK